ncbi:MAG: plastocyanin/azurin family copper-binding protein [bacterium]
MRISPKSLFFLASILAGVFVGGSAGAAPSTTVTWKVSSLMAGEAKNLSAVVSTNSPGAKTWSKKGLCTLTPTSKPTKLTMGSTGSCVLTLKIAQSKSYPAISSTKTIIFIAPITTTTAAPSGPAATVSNSGSSFSPSNTRISVGQAVSFNVSSSHNVRWEDGAAGRGTTDAAYSRTFSSAGSYSFYCSFHSGMEGTITVG